MTNTKEKNIDITAFFSVTYGLFVVTTECEGKLNGQISNTVIQITDQPNRMLVSINKKELTHELIMKRRCFGVSVLQQGVPMTFIGTFGFKSGRDIDKFKDVQYKKGPLECPLVTDYALAVFELELTDTADAGTHTVFIGEVTHAEIINKQAAPLTYDYYHTVMKGKSPEFAPVAKVDKHDKQKQQEILEFEEQKQKAQQKIADNNVVENKQKAEISDTERSQGMKKYVCNVCGYVYDPEKGDPDGGIEPGTSFEDIPGDWVCPICGVGKDEFSPA